MLSSEEIDRIRRACESLSQSEVLAFATAAVYRVLPVYQAYCEFRPEVGGHHAAHDAVVAIWRLLRRRPTASDEVVARKVAAANEAIREDFAVVNAAEEFSGLAEALVGATLSVLTSVFDVYVNSSRSAAFDAATSALEIDLIWAEGIADDSDHEDDGIVSPANLAAHYGMQLRDIDELSGRSGVEDVERFRIVSMRAEGEGLGYLTRMRGLVGT